MWSGARHSTHGVINVGADDEAFAPAVGVLDRDDVAGLDARKTRGGKREGERGDKDGRAHTTMSASA